MTAAQESGKPAVAREHVADRAQWETLRTAAYRGQLQPEGFRRLDQIHARHPEWREEWDQ